MALDDLKKRLFKPNETFPERRGEPDLSPAYSGGVRTWGGDSDPRVIEERREQKKRRHTRTIFWSMMTLLVFVLAGGVATFIFLNNEGNISADNIELTILSPETIAAGEHVTFEVRYANRNEVALESVELIFEYPDGARPVFGEAPRRGRFRERIPIGRLLPGGEGEERFEAFVFGDEGVSVKADATLEYRPENTSARFGKDTSALVMVNKSPIGITISVPEEINNGQEVELTIDYVSTGESAFEDVSLEIRYPDNFSMISAVPAPGIDNSIWHIGALEPDAEGTITVRGILTGNPLDSHFFEAQIGIFDEETKAWNTYARASHNVHIREALLSVDLLVGGENNVKITPGGIIVFSVPWRNNLPVSVQNALIEVILEGEQFNYGNVSVEGGSYDGVNKRVLVNASTDPRLEFLDPGESGSFTFSVGTVENPSVQSIRDKNFTVSARARIYSNFVPEGYEGVDITGTDSLSASFITRVDFVSKGLHRSGVIPNGGPMPPRVGEETTYTITWSLTNVSNDVENGVVESSLPAYVRWKNVVNPANEKITYNSNTGRIMWDVGFLVAGTGFTRPAREVSFQVGLVPNQNHVGSQPALITEARFEGHDIFTDTPIAENRGEVSTTLRDDPLVDGTEYKVVQ
ncbi:MAG: hypothetical protein COU90_00630 [Candidatus Ryanbacteria bacterium CG10_big_fil_rev_8_21_14_0_10_43_42]|uniref:DUF11 domain-containing protein n=1 Tax=Candidatus Ryanbacteria bacterium CG10_big_fil_rev_8_21_14_0_10_43_42 TaxID=1974864 RepID=A0A2M8KXY8_9BACT|nr:MAG: hypothetical protein COU90_00630 [Candidatus Ryanbacteria bacterium CG10_big_fil_rev_8_21_14_0_10_43_42]